MKRAICFLAAALTLASGCHRALSDRLAGLGLKPESATADTLILAGPKHRIVLRHGSAAAAVNGVPVQLPGPATRDRKGKWDLPAAAVDGVLRPVLDSAPRRVATILLDPGHGGHDTGTRAASGRTEKELNLALGLQLAAALRAAGFTVHLTRENDLFLPLDHRAELAARHGAQLLISIHHNAAANPRAEGIETFALTPIGAPSSSGGKGQNARFNGNRFDGENLLLAYLIQNALLRRTGAVDRGIKRARFAVLKDINAPGVLVELGFVSNPREERLLNDRDYIEKLARAIAEGILCYRDGVRP